MIGRARPNRRRDAPLIYGYPGQWPAYSPRKLVGGAGPVHLAMARNLKLGERSIARGLSMPALRSVDYPPG